MDDQEREHLADDLAKRIASKMQGMCVGACGLSHEARSEMSHIIGVLKDQGDESYGKGAEKLRSLLKLAGRIDTVSTWVARALIVFIAIAILKTCGQWGGAGAIDWMKKVLGGP